MTQMAPVDTGYHRARLTAEDFDVLDRHGAFSAYHKAELIDGDIYFVNAQHRPHGMAKMRLYDALRDVLRDMRSPYRAVCEFTLDLSPVDRPEPDILLTSEPDGDGPVPLRSVPLVIEVSDTTVDADLGTKRVRYALAGIGEYWVVDINDRAIHQMWQPDGGDYRQRRECPFGAALTAMTLPGLTIPASAL
jgi:Uma2 family endonuclease